MCSVVSRVLTGAFDPWPIKLSSRISTDSSSRGHQPDAPCRRQKYNSRYLGVGRVEWGGESCTKFIYGRLLLFTGSGGVKFCMLMSLGIVAS